MGQVIQQKRDKKPEVEVLYHKIVDCPKPGRPWWFELTLQSSVYWSAKTVQVKRTSDGVITTKQDHAAQLLTPDEWHRKKTHIAWTTRWTTRGLACVRPAVYVVEDIVVPPQSFIILL